MLKEGIARRIAVGITALAASVGCERKPHTNEKSPTPNYSAVEPESPDKSQQGLSLTMDEFESLPRDLPQSGFLLYANLEGTQGRVVFDDAKSFAGRLKRGEFDLVGRIPSTKDANGLWDPMIVKPSAYSQLLERHPGIEVKDWLPWGWME